jgi:hypothetical protein
MIIPPPIPTSPLAIPANNPITSRIIIVVRPMGGFFDIV